MCGEEKNPTEVNLHKRENSEKRENLNETLPLGSRVNVNGETCNNMLALTHYCNCLTKDCTAENGKEQVIS